MSTGDGDSPGDTVGSSATEASDGANVSTESRTPGRTEEAVGTGTSDNSAPPLSETPEQARCDSEASARLLERALVTSGVILVVLGIVLWVSPRPLLVGLFESVDGNEQTTRVALAGTLLAGVFLSRFLLSSVPEPPLPPLRVETRSGGTTSEELAIQPGSDIDGRLREILNDQHVYDQKRGELTADLKEVAIGTLCYVHEIPEERAIELLDSGEWTENENAQALFKDRTDVSFRIRFYRWLSPRQTYRREVWAAVNEICAQVET